MTGGSAGLGRALAIELVQRGAHVTIVARGQARLDEVKAELEVGSGTEQLPDVSGSRIWRAPPGSSFQLKLYLSVKLTPNTAYTCRE